MASKEDAKLASELKELTKQRIDLEKQIVEQKIKIGSEEKKSIENIKQLVSLEALRMDSIEKEEEVRKKIEGIEKESEKRIKDFEKYEKESLNRTKEQNKGEDDLTKKQKERIENSLPNPLETLLK